MIGMSLPSLADFLETLSSEGELARVAVEVDAELEIAAITDRIVKADGPALLFERVRGHRHVVVTNLFGSMRRISKALGGGSLDELAERIERLPETSHRAGWLERLKSRTAEPALDRFSPKTVKAGACQQVVKLGRDVDLGELPAMRSWPEESVRSITAGQVLSLHAETGQRSLERSILPILDANRLAIDLNSFQRATANFRHQASRSEKLPLAVVLGGSPAQMLVSDLPAGEGVDPIALAGLLGGDAVEMVRARTQPLEVPAGAELVLEGYIDGAEAPVRSGKYMGPMGFYCETSEAHAIHVTAITHRSNAAFPASLLARPPCEATAVGRLFERLLLSTVRAAAPEVVALALPACGARHNFVFVSIHKTFPEQARKVASAIWGLGALMLAKIVVVVDAHVDVHDTCQVLFRVGANVFPGRDVFFQDGPCDPFDHALPVEARGRKVGIDATAKLPGEHPRPWPHEATASEETRSLVERRWQEYGLDERR